MNLYETYNRTSAYDLTDDDEEMMERFLRGVMGKVCVLICEALLKVCLITINITFLIL